MKHALWALVAGMLVGCGPDVEGVCERLADRCPSTEYPYHLKQDECIDDGHRLEHRASRAGCEDAFDDYLDCVDSKNCHWNTDCEGLRLAVHRCIDGD
jgi:hypothetical protein